MFSAEREGFEPPEPFSSTVFKTAVIDHSTTSPICRSMPFNFIKAVSGNCFFLETAFILCGGRRSRTDDPLLAKQVL